MWSWLRQYCKEVYSILGTVQIFYDYQEAYFLFNLVMNHVDVHAILYRTSILMFPVEFCKQIVWTGVVGIKKKRNDLNRRSCLDRICNVANGHFLRKMSVRYLLKCWLTLAWVQIFDFFLCTFWKTRITHAHKQKKSKICTHARVNSTLTNNVRTFYMSKKRPSVNANMVGHFRFCCN